MLQQIPRAVTVAPPSLEIVPPLIADVCYMLDIADVVIIGLVADVVVNEMVFP